MGKHTEIEAVQRPEQEECVPRDQHAFLTCRRQGMLMAVGRVDLTNDI
jgi:hypothetical protein